MKQTNTPSQPSIVIDCQIFQTYSWQRGMGKYSLELIRIILAQPELQSRAIYLLFNSNADDNLEAKDILRKIAPTAQFLDIELELPRQPRAEHSIQPTRLKNKEILNRFINEYFDSSAKPDFLILSLYLDEVCSVFPDTLIINNKILIYYDSIPYLYHTRYGQFPGFFDHYYLPHTASVFEATKVLTISKTVANDLHLYFGVQTERIFAIDGASIPRSAQKPVKPKGWKLPPNGFVLMPSGQEIRKNNPRAVEAFDNFVKQADKDYTLVITSHFTKEGRADLEALSDNILFSGNVSEAELLWLYQNCRFVLFASEYEGLGLPVLEAVEQNKLIACSDISVFREMSDTAFHYFDPLDVNAITSILHETESAAEVSNLNDNAYEVVAKKYTWHRTGQEFIKALATNINLSKVQKKKIAVFCPEPGGFSAIGKDIGELHAWYTSYFDVEYYFDKGPNHMTLRPNILKYAAPCHKAEDFKAEDYERYDAVVYHIGNSEYHLNIIRAALVFPGYMILHDTNLNGLYHNLAELEYISHERHDIEQRLDKLAGKGKKYDDYSTFITSVVNNQLAVVVHSDYARKAVQAKLITKIPVEYLELPFDTPIFTDINQRKNRSKVSVAFAGIIAKIKGIDLMETIAFSDKFSDCQINIFGFSVIETEQLKKLRELPNVKLMTNPTDFEFQQLIANSDILINVRLAYKGETSGSTLSHMRYGGIAIVRDFGWFSELPDDTVIKVQKPEETFTALREILDDDRRRELLHKKATMYMQQNHSHKAYSEGMYRLISSSKSVK